MNLPKVIFTDISLDKEADWMHGFLFQNEWGWGKRITEKYPEIEKVFSLKTENEQVDFIKNYIIEFRKKNQELIEKNKTEYQKNWLEIGKDFFSNLSEI